MPSPGETLRAAGLWPPSDQALPGVRAECAGLARRIREMDVHTLGLVPASDAVAVPAVALELGRALADRSVGLVGVLDGDGSWPCARALRGGAAASEERLAATSWLAVNLAVLTPREGEAGGALALLRGILEQEAGAFHHLLVDLTGFDHSGEHLAALDAVGAAAVVARSGRSTAGEIERWRRDLAGRRNLGVLLTGL